ncbi:MAG: hypothetical protein ABJB05_06195 [Parafilimonas sp.]
MFNTNYYTMIVDTIIDLQDRGFTSDFSLLGSRLFCAQMKCFFNSDQFDVIEVHSFESEQSNKEETIVYAIECFANAVKGILFERNSNHQNVIVTKLRKFWK